jgi:precorrin-3B synthase
VHWSGCARRCGRPRGPAGDVVAMAEGYQVLRDDRLEYFGTEVAVVRIVAAHARRRG